MVAVTFVQLIFSGLLLVATRYEQRLMCSCLTDFDRILSRFNPSLYVFFDGFGLFVISQLPLRIRPRHRTPTVPLKVSCTFSRAAHSCLITLSVSFFWEFFTHSLLTNVWVLSPFPLRYVSFFQSVLTERPFASVCRLHSVQFCLFFAVNSVTWPSSDSKAIALN